MDYIKKSLAILEGKDDETLLERIVELLKDDNLDEDLQSVASTISVGTAVLNLVPRVKDLAADKKLSDEQLAVKIYNAILHSGQLSDKKLMIALQRLNDKFGFKRDINRDVKDAVAKKSAHDAEVGEYRKSIRNATGEDPRASRNN